MSERLILLTNDDGLWSPGIAALARAAARFGRVVTVAPDRNRSAISSALSLHNILRLNEVGPDRFACDGTPVDCVLLGVCEVLGRRPDWVLSGVNLGFNLGEDVFYSGTVGAAFEGRLQGARAVAFSQHPNGSLDQAEPWIDRFLERWEAMDLPANRIWNVNFPKGEPKGFHLTSQDSRDYHDLVERRIDPR
ncbi:MAG TPA: 5'/3'-nucleotidase SurE, partial [Geothrix sp.]